MNAKQAFQRVKALIGQAATKQSTLTSDPDSFANDLNNFYARFDSSDFSAECESLLDFPPYKLEYECLLTRRDVQLQLLRCKCNKDSGPDCMMGQVLKICSLELSPVLHSLFLRSLCTFTMPVMWETSTVENL